MANGRQRDEWSRFGELLSLVHNRTAFGKDAKATQSIDWIPKQIISAAEMHAINEAIRKERESRIVKVPFSVIRDIVLGGNRGSQ